MARRASSKLNTQGLFVGGGVLAAVLLIGFFTLGKKNNSFADADPLRMEEVEMGTRMLAGNEHRVEGKIFDNRVSPTGHLVALEVTENGRTIYLPILLGDEVKNSGVNFVRGQDYAFLVRFDSDGMAHALKVQRY